MTDLRKRAEMLTASLLAEVAHGEFDSEDVIQWADKLLAFADEVSAERVAEERATWIPVGERAPEYDVPVWMYFDDGSIFVGAVCEDSDGWLWGKTYGSEYFHDGKWKCEAETDDDYQPTHWMELPQPPQEKEPT